MTTKSVLYAYPASPRGKKSGTWYTLPDNRDHPTYAAAFAHAETLPGEYDAETMNQVIGTGGTRYRVHRSSLCPITGKTAWHLLDAKGFGIAFIGTDGILDMGKTLDNLPREYADDFKRHVDLLKGPAR